MLFVLAIIWLINYSFGVINKNYSLTQISISRNNLICICVNSSREAIGKCVGPIPGTLTTLKCTDREQTMMENTLQSTGRALAGLCGEAG